jgi:hypothetical protein
MKSIKTTNLVVFFCPYFTCLKPAKTVDFRSKNSNKNFYQVGRKVFLDFGTLQRINKLQLWKS